MSDRSLKVRVCDFIATGFYSGLLKPAPGTWGTAAAVVAIGFFHHLFPGVDTLFIAVFLTGIGIWSANVVWQAKLYPGGKKEDDPGEIVIDEFAGYAVALVGLPMQWQSYLACFLLFRLFDIVKPPPVKWFEKFTGGVGIVLDDVMAGIYSALAYRLILAASGVTI